MARRDTRSEPLSRAEIARVALVMVDRDGSDGFSMRNLATELRVTPMAVYHHFESKAEVLQAAADQVWIEVVVATEEHDDPVEAIAQGYLATRRAFQRHPGITPYAVASPATEDAVHLMASVITELFEQAGFSGEDGADAYFALATFTLGSAALHSQRLLLDHAIRTPVSDLGELGSVPDDAAPSATYWRVRDAMGADPDLVRFERVLRDLLAGLVERHAGRPTTS